MSTAYKILPHYTYDDYCRWEGAWELIEGIPHAMSPAPQPRHQAIAGNLHAEFRTALKKKNCNCTAYQPIDYKLSEETVLNPDLLIVCNPIMKAFLDFTPALVAEILSPATALKDRHTKFQLYQQAGVPYYLIIDGERQTIEIYKMFDSTYKQQNWENNTPYDFDLGACTATVMLSEIWQ